MGLYVNEDSWGPASSADGDGHLCLGLLSPGSTASVLEHRWAGGTGSWRPGWDPAGQLQRVEVVLLPLLGKIAVWVTPQASCPARLKFSHEFCMP